MLIIKPKNSGCGLSFHKRCASRIPNNCSNNRQRRPSAIPLSPRSSIGLQHIVNFLKYFLLIAKKFSKVVLFFRPFLLVRCLIMLQIVPIVKLHVQQLQQRLELVRKFHHQLQLRTFWSLASKPMMVIQLAAM